MFKILWSVFFLMGCSNMPVSNPDWEKTITPKEVIVKPGKVTLVEFEYEEFLVPTLHCGNGDEYFLIRKKNKFKAFIAESYFSKNKKYQCFISDGKKQAAVFNVKVKNYPYKKERLYVNKRRVSLSKKDQKRAIKEQKMLNGIYAGFHRKPFFNDKFKTPLNSKITSYYGTRRIFNGHKKTQHLGTDYRAPVGVKIKSVNRGKVVFAGNLFYTGNAVIVDHGAGIFSVYGHLSKIVAQTGEMVMKDSLLGYSGKTGRVSGPHLHWGVKIAGHWVDGISLVKEGI